MGIFDTVEDITHHSKRTQEGNLRAAGKLAEETPEPEFIRSKVPQNITLETAIQYFENNAHGEFSNLYRQTAKWLNEFLAIPKSEVRKSMQSTSVKGDDSEV